MENLWFFVGVLVGAAVWSPLEYLSNSIRERHKVRPSLVVLVWQLFLIILLIEFWIASISISKDEMGVGQFLLFLLLPFGAMVLALISKPRIEPEAEQFAEFQEQQIVFFSILAALPAISFLREIVAGESIPLDADLVYRALVFIGALIGIFLSKQRALLVHAVVMLVLMSAYLFDVYATVPA